MHSKLQQSMKDYLPGGGTIIQTLVYTQCSLNSSHTMTGLKVYLVAMIGWIKFSQIWPSQHGWVFLERYNEVAKRMRWEKHKEALMTLAEEKWRAVLWEAREDTKYVFERSWNKEVKLLNCHKG